MFVQFLNWVKDFNVASLSLVPKELLHKYDAEATPFIQIQARSLRTVQSIVLFVSRCAHVKVCANITQTWRFLRRVSFPLSCGAVLRFTDCGFGRTCSVEVLVLFVFSSISDVEEMGRNDLPYVSSRSCIPMG